jgi:hypothetical protein
MSELTMITAKVLILVEAILDNFVTLTGVTNIGLSGCDGQNIPVLVGTIDTCGTILAAQVANLAVLGLNIVGQILPGLFVQGTAP